ncbi:MAG: hypothetical protein EBY17_12425 [Acidobacteriia bacterium]|nr:hypothetical protein [Terriglobia bacterium]
MDRVNLIPLLRQPDIHPGQSLFSHLTRRRVGQNVAFQAVMVRVLRRVVDTGQGGHNHPSRRTATIDGDSDSSGIGDTKYPNDLIVGVQPAHDEGIG